MESVDRHGRLPVPAASIRHVRARSGSGRGRAAGLDFVSVSVCLSTPDAGIPWSSPAFMALMVERIRREAGLPVAIARGVGSPKAADDAVRSGRADLVKAGRALLANPHCPYAAATTLGVDHPFRATLPAPYAHWLEH